MTTDPSPMTLSVRCPDCGPMPVLLDGVVIVHVGNDERATFTCPRCTVPASMSLHPALVPALKEQGVPYVDLPTRQQHLRIRTEITEAECDSFDRQVAKAAFLSWLATA